LHGYAAVFYQSQCVGLHCWADNIIYKELSKASELNVPKDLALPIPVRALANKVNVMLAPLDAMYKGNDRHYLSCGASALTAILSSLYLAGISAPSNILDFGSGAGRVTRWLRAAFPDAMIEACDLRDTDLDFCEKMFGAKTWTSGTDIDVLFAPQSYDLVWAGSVITHLDAQKTQKLISKIMSWLNPGGLFVFSTHGRYTASKIRSGHYGVGEASREIICSEYEANFFGYADYPRQNGYGISITGMRWIQEFIESRNDCRLVLLSERAWDGHHDVVALQACDYREPLPFR
jgi:SAM-dependent methyltransferase